MIDLRKYKENNFEISDLIDYLKTYSWLSFILNNPNTDEEMYAEIENMVHRMSNVLFHYITKKNISKKVVSDIIKELEKENYNYLEGLYEFYEEDL